MHIFMEILTLLTNIVEVHSLNVYWGWGLVVVYSYIQQCPTDFFKKRIRSQLNI